MGRIVPTGLVGEVVNLVAMFMVLVQQPLHFHARIPVNMLCAYNKFIIYMAHIRAYTKGTRYKAQGTRRRGAGKRDRWQMECYSLKLFIKNGLNGKLYCNSSILLDCMEKDEMKSIGAWLSIRSFTRK